MERTNCYGNRRQKKVKALGVQKLLLKVHTMILKLNTLMEKVNTIFQQGI